MIKLSRETWLRCLLPYYLRSITTVSFPNPRFHEKINTSDGENFYANQTRARRAVAGRARLCQRAQALPERRADANGFRRVRLRRERRPGRRRRSARHRFAAQENPRLALPGIHSALRSYGLPHSPQG